MQRGLNYGLLNYGLLFARRESTLAPGEDAMNHDDFSLSARLLWLEQRDLEISVQLHELTWQRERNRDEALRLRVSMTHEDLKSYEALKLEAAVLMEEANHRGEVLVAIARRKPGEVVGVDEVLARHI
jgi:hypothetical protein